MHFYKNPLKNNFFIGPGAHGAPYGALLKGRHDEEPIEKVSTRNPFKRCRRGAHSSRGLMAAPSWAEI